MNDPVALVWKGNSIHITVTVIPASTAKGNHGVLLFSFYPDNMEVLVL